MKQHIIEELQRLEAERNIRILYAVESGSRAWGFASDNSDWDVRFIYVHKLDWYLQIGEKKDTIELMLEQDLDLSGWDLRKALALFRKSNPPLLEWLESPIVYIENQAIMNEWRGLIETFFNPKNVMYHYLRMAVNTYKNYLERDTLKLKKYFYALRPLFACRWIEQHGTMPPVLFVDMLKDFDNTAIRAIIDQLLIEKKSAQELGERPKIDLLNEFIIAEITYFETYLKKLEIEKLQDWEVLNVFFRRIIKNE